MAWAGASSGGRSSGGFSRRRRRDGALVELTPLIDIVFQLLIFFLLTATFQDTSSLDVDLAQAKSKQKSPQKQAIVLSIDSQGRFELDNHIVDASELELRLCKHAKQGQTSLNIRADRSSQHAALVTAMDSAKRCGLKSMGILHQNQ